MSIPGWRGMTCHLYVKFEKSSQKNNVEQVLIHVGKNLASYRTNHNQ
jgi:hypothetical protein